MIEKVGKVTLDYEYYPGEDKYCDGEVEDQLLQAVIDNDISDYQKVIEKNNNWPFLYHLSPLRGNIVEWLPITKDMKVLEVGSGCGAITGTLAAKCGELTCIDLSKKRSLINANRNRECENVTIHVGNFQDIEPGLPGDYDYICLIGVFEYAQAYIDSKDPYGTFLNIIRSHLKESGHIVIAIENRMGLKYLAGCQEDHLGKYFAGVENYPEGGVVRTFTKPALEEICKRCGVSEYSFYYPYPDYKFMHTIYSDRRLPEKGELTTNLRNFDRDRLLLFDEKLAFDSVIDDGMFDYFANSYMLVIGEKFDTVYSKYSNDRQKKYSIRTDITNDGNSRKAVKIAVSAEATEHIRNIENAYRLLCDKYVGSELSICPCSINEDTVEFPFLNGETLENVLDEYLVAGDMEGFNRLLHKFYEIAKYNADMEVSDFDLIFGNILIDGDNWQLIDYEWTYERAQEPADVLKRALFCYMLGGGLRKSLDMQLILRTITGEPEVSWDEEALWASETDFQESVTGGHLSLSQMRDSIHNEVLPLTSAIARFKENTIKEQAQVYYDPGTGFSEELSEFVALGNKGNAKVLSYALNGNVQKLRIDPCMEPCIVNVIRIAVGDKEYPVKKLKISGKSLGKSGFVFADNDPNFTIDLKKYAGATELVFEYEITKISESLATGLIK